MNVFADMSPLEVLCRSVAPDDPIDWHTHPHDEFCLVLEGSPTIGHAGGKMLPQADTLFLFKKGEMHGVWNAGPVDGTPLAAGVSSQLRPEDAFLRTIQTSAQTAGLQIVRAAAPTIRQRLSETGVREGCTGLSERFRGIRVAHASAGQRQPVASHPPRT